MSHNAPDTAQNTAFKILEANAIFRQIARDPAFKNTAMVSSFGAEPAVLLHLLSCHNKAMPILFVDTSFLFQETLEYQTTLAAQLGLPNVHIIRADTATIETQDPKRDLHLRAPNACCALRKTRPLFDALAPYDSWITGRKRFHGADRTALPIFEPQADGKTKINPLARLSAQDIHIYMKKHDLPAHPLITKGYRSIGCRPCTTPSMENESPRAGRWRGQEKTECGIHFPAAATVTERTAL